MQFTVIYDSQPDKIKPLTLYCSHSIQAVSDFTGVSSDMFLWYWSSKHVSHCNVNSPNGTLYRITWNMQYFSVSVYPVHQSKLI